MEKNYLDKMIEKYGSEDGFINALSDGREGSEELLSYVSTLTEDVVINSIMVLTVMVMFEGLKVKNEDVVIN